MHINKIALHYSAICPTVDLELQCVYFTTSGLRYGTVPAEHWHTQTVQHCYKSEWLQSNLNPRRRSFSYGAFVWVAKRPYQFRHVRPSVCLSVCLSLSACMGAAATGLFGRRGGEFYFEECWETSDLNKIGQKYQAICTKKHVYIVDSSCIYFVARQQRKRVSFLHLHVDTFTLLTATYTSALQRETIVAVQWKLWLSERAIIFRYIYIAYLI